MVKRLLSVKINISGEEPIPADVVIHGKIPRAPDRSCRNCAKKNDCKILQYSLAQVATLAFRPISEGNLMEYSDLSFPMPCRGIEWTSIFKSLQSVFIGCFERVNSHCVDGVIV